MSRETAWLHDLFESFGAIETRRMFGGLGIYRDSLMFGLVAGGEIYLKTDAESAGDFTAADSVPFSFTRQGKVVATSYWRLPEAALDDPDLLREWAERAWAAALRKNAT